MNFATISTSGSSLTRLRHVVALCDAFEAELREGRPTEIEKYLGLVPEADRNRLLRELLMLELDYRRGRGELPTQAEYKARLPGRESSIMDAFSGSPAPGEATHHARPDEKHTVREAGDRHPGRFRILRSHARGGLGEVFVAVDNEIQREVALKEIRADRADSPESHARFLIEGELTGRLEHPGIVPVYSLGYRGDGRPYYAMRLIRGESLKEAIDRHHSAAESEPAAQALDLQGLLRRFLAVCYAVDYAHSRGVVHRDLKPANIMLGAFGETLVVDWGLAKAIGDPDPNVPDPGSRLFPASASADTLPGSTIGTPSYMSPEQARAELDRVGPASDVYSLGATLYCILVGRPPFDGTEVEAVLKSVRRGDVQLPARSGPDVDRALQAVCLKAMAAEPGDRYPTARALAGDLERWMADEPVTAWVEPMTRRARRWVRRNRTAVSGAAISLIAAVLGLISVNLVQLHANERLKRANQVTQDALLETGRAKEATEQSLTKSELLRREAEESRKQAESISKFLIEAFSSPDPNRDGREIKIVEILDRATKLLENEFTGAETTRAALLHALGETHHGLGLDAQAVTLHERALGIREKALGPDHRDTLQSRNDLGWAIHMVGRTAEAIPLIEAAFRRREAVLGATHPDTLSSRNDLGCVYRAVGRAAEAVVLHEGTLKLREAVLGPDHYETLSTRSSLAVAYRNCGRIAEATATLEGTRRSLSASVGPDHPLALRCCNNLAMAYAYGGRLPDAIHLHEQTLRKREKVLGTDHYETLVSRSNLANTYERAGRVGEAARFHEGTLQLSRSKYGLVHPQTLTVMKDLARTYESLGRWRDAEVLRRESLAHTRTVAPPNKRALSTDLADLGSNLLDQGKWVGAESLLGECESILIQISPEDWTRFHARGLLGAALLGQGRLEEAEALISTGHAGVVARGSKVPALARQRLTGSILSAIRRYETRGHLDSARLLALKVLIGCADLPSNVFDEVSY